VRNERCVRRARAALGAAAFRAAHVGGEALAVEAAVAEALAAPAGRSVQPSPRATGLTPREREVAALVVEGLTNRQIARRLGVAECTAASHLEHIRDKLGVQSRAQIAAWAVAEDPGRAHLP
jgi:non-specific serine/threonine protein kinase